MKFLQHRRDHTDTPRARLAGYEWESNPLPLSQRSELAKSGLALIVSATALPPPKKKNTLISKEM